MFRRINGDFGFKLFRRCVAGVIPDVCLSARNLLRTRDLGLF
jgi:hypothetical protein